MLEQVSNYDQDIEFVEGFAGSGKSTRLADQATPNTLVLTPTHKAAGVLISKGVENVYTIHSTLKLVPTLNQNYVPGKHKMQALKRIGDTDMKNIKDVFIDEFSMIPTHIFDLLLGVLPSHAKVTVFGDPYQLKPVDGEPIDPEVYTDKIVQLTKQHRAEAPEVVETFMRFMNYLKDGSEMDLKLNPAIEHGTIKGFNPDTDRALAFTNKRVIEINAEIAKHLKMPKEYSTGETLFANTIECVKQDMDYDKEFIYPKCVAKGKLMEQPELQISMDRASSDIERFNTDLSDYDVCTVSVDGEEYNVYYSVDHYKIEQELKADIDEWQAYVYNNNDIDKETVLTEWCKYNKGKPGVRERGRAWSRYIAHKGLVFSLQRPFATTVHKSQGSEFSTVYIAQSDIKKSIRNGYYETYARLMYVALSRAISKVIII